MLHEKLEQSYEKLHWSYILVAPMTIVLFSLVINPFIITASMLQNTNEANGIWFYGALWLLNSLAIVASVMQVTDIAALKIAGIKLHTVQLKQALVSKKTIAVMPLYLFGIETVLLVLSNYTDVSYTGGQRITDILVFTILFSVIHYIYALYNASNGTEREYVLERTAKLDTHAMYSLEINEINQWTNNILVLKKIEDTLSFVEIEWINKRQKDMIKVLELYRGIKLASNDETRENIIEAINELNELLEAYIRVDDGKKINKIERKLERMKGEQYVK